MEEGSSYQDGISDALGWTTELLELVEKLEDQGIMEIHEVIAYLKNKLEEDVERK